MKSKLLGLMALVSLLGLSPAIATPFNWTESYGSGTFATSYVSGDEYLITGITGTIDGNTITALIAPGGYGNNDNELFYPSTPQLDDAGFSFVAGGTTWNMFYSTDGYYQLSSPVGLCVSGCIDQTFSAAPTPLPAALPLFATGLGALGLLGWRRKRKAHATA